MRKTVGEHEDARLGRTVRDRPLQPHFDAGPVFHHELSIGERGNVLRRRLVIFRRSPNRHEIVNLHQISADALHERIQRRECRNDLLSWHHERRHWRRQMSTSLIAGPRFWWATRKLSAQAPRRLQYTLAARRAPPEKFHSVIFQFETVVTDEVVREPLDRLARNLVDTPAFTANGVVMMRRGAADVGCLAACIKARARLALRFEHPQRPVNRRERDLRPWPSLTG